MREIAELLGVSTDAVVYFMRRQGIARRTPSENNAIRFEQKHPSFKVKSSTNKYLEAFGTALYWAEGAKSKSAGGIDFANSDPKMIAFFLAFLRDRYTLDEKRLRVFLYCHSRKDIQNLIRFWSHLTRIPHSQFTNPYIQSGSDSKKHKMPYGLVHIRYYDKKLLNDVKNLIQSYVRGYASVDP